MKQLSKSVYRPPDWEAWAQEDEAGRQLPAPRNNLVLPAREPARVEILPPEATDWSVNLSQTTHPPVELKTTYLDRAKGFQVETVPLAVAAGFLAVVLATVGLGRPFGPGLILWFSMTFFLVWLVGYALHRIVGPDGALFWSVFGAFLLLRSEQRERHRRMRRMERDL